MGGKKQAGPRSRGQTDAGSARDRQMQALGQLHFLAAFCPLHRKMPGEWLSGLFIPAVNHDCVRFFKNDQGHICAALIWARLSDEVSQRMVYDNVPPEAGDWASGSNLWFLDILAPFDHGRMVARHIARHPPPDPFRFARLGPDGRIAKVVRGDAMARGAERVQAFFVDPDRREAF